MKNVWVPRQGDFQPCMGNGKRAFSNSDPAWKLKFKMVAGVPFHLLGVQSAGKIGVGFTIDTDFFW